MSQACSAQKDYSELRDNWRLLVAALVGTAVGAPTLSFYTIGVFAPIFAVTFGWSVGFIMSGVAIVMAAMLLGGPLIGMLIDRHGPRRVAALSLLGLGLSYMTLAVSNGSSLLYHASWVTIAITGVGATGIAMTRAISGAFVARRGLALGIALSGTGIFAFLIKPLAAVSIDLFGWRVAVLLIGLCPILIGAPVVWWGLWSRTGANPARVPGPRDINPLAGLAVAPALRSRAFWLLAPAFFLVSIGNGAPFPNMENILRAAGIAGPDIVPLTAMIGVTLVAGRLMGGWLADRVWAPALGAGIMVLAAAGLWMLSQPSLTTMSALAAICLIGIAAGLEIDLLSFLVARYIGLRSYGAIYGLILGLFAVGAGAGPGLMGYIYDVSGSYGPALYMCGFAMLGAAGLFLLLGRYPDLPSGDGSVRER